ncbi:MAG: DUF624 domain-containing protein [Defluviitaleaceae bacterium]|nr:DUF624 domain-containing protein [Defluviitaleaceae bacterium]
MREFFSLEGNFNKYGGFVADTLILSLLWILFSIPVITIGASTAALFYVATRRIANREGYITSDFWQAFKANFAKATVLWIFIFVIIILLIWNMWLALENPELMGAFGGIVLPAQIVILVEVLFITTFIFPVTARFDMGIKETIKTCFFMANRHLLTSFTCVASIGILLWLSFLVWPPLLFVTPGIYAMFASFMIMRIFKKYRPEMDKDPVLELQELELQRAEEKRLAEIGKIAKIEEEQN